MPLTILNTGTFNGTAAGLAAASATALTPAPGTSAAAGFPASSAAALTGTASVGAADAGPPTAAAAAVIAAGAGNPVIRGVPQYYNSGSAVSGTTFAVTKDPGTASGDAILIFMTWNGTGTTPSVAGFTSYTKTTNGFGIALFSRVADGSEGSTFTVTFAAGFNVAAVCVAYRNANGILDPVPSSSGTITLATTVIPGASITTAKTNDVLVWFGAVRANGTGAPVPVIGVPSGLAPEGSQTSSGNAVGANMSVLMADGPGGTPGATGAMTGTASLTDNAGGVLLALESSTTVPVINVSAGFAAASAWAAINAVGSGTSASAVVAAATGASQDPSVSSGLSTIVGSYIAEGFYPGSLTHAQAISHWSSNTGRTMACERIYLGKNSMPVAVNATLTAARSAGRTIMLSYKPSLFGAATPLGGGASQAALDTSCNTYMTALVSAGFTAANCLIDLWQEPYFSGITGAGGNATAANFITMFQHYYPIISSYGFTVGFCTSAASVFNQNENSYYPGDAFCDYVLTDYYFPQYGTSSPPLHPLGSGNATHDAAYPADNASPPKPFGLGEFNSSNWSGAGYTKTQATAYWNYLLTYFSGRLAAGKPCAPLCMFNSDGGSASAVDSPCVVADGVTDPYSAGTTTALEYRNALLAALIDGLA